MDIQSLLALTVEKKASDLHLSAGLSPMLRIHGHMHTLDHAVLSHEDVLGMAHSLMSTEQKDLYRSNLEIDISFEASNLARFRVNAFIQQRGAGLVLRVIPTQILTLEELKAPLILQDLALRPRGLVLVTGPTGSGKSTTLAAMVDYYNKQHAGHVLTIEDPIEFIHTSQKSLINQREVNRHTHSFSHALRSALREDPDVILVGEMRDLETIRLALTAAETGHLVLGTLHTSSAAKTVDRIVDVFAAGEKDMIRTMLSESLQGVISQTLCPRLDGEGRVAAYELLLTTPAIRNLIRENKIAQMYSSIQTGQSQGMQTLDQHLAQLVSQKIISSAEAKSKAKMPENFGN